MFNVIFPSWIFLLQQERAFLITIPCALSPTMVSPAKAESHVRLARFDHFLKYLIKNFLPVSPIMPIHEALHASYFSQFSLSLSRLWQSQIVKPKFTRQLGLVMSWEQRLGFRHVSPLGKPRFPPFVIEIGRIILG